MSSLGAVVQPWNSRATEFVPLVRAAEVAGLDEVWLWEDCFQEGAIGAAGAVLASTERIRVGLGVLPTPLRNVALTAMEIATLCSMFPGRLVPGVGHGFKDWMEQVGARPASPLTLMREYTTALRALLAGERVTVSGRYVRLSEVELGRPPVPVPPVACGAVGPRTLALVGELADGVVLDGSTGVPGVERALELIRPQRPFSATVYVPTLTGPDAEERARATLIRNGLPSTAVLDDYVAWGSAAQIAAVYDRFAAAGATSVVAEQPQEHDLPDPESFIRFIGAEVRPLLSAADEKS